MKRKGFEILFKVTFPNEEGSPVGEQVSSTAVLPVEHGYFPNEF